MNSEPNVIVKDDYILVEFMEVDYWQIWDAIRLVRNLPESYGKNEIWIFGKGPIGLTDVSLHKLNDFIKEIYPKGLNKSKTAIVADKDEQSVIASLFSQIAGELPFEIKVFSDFRDAKEWIIKI